MILLLDYFDIVLFNNNFLKQLEHYRFEKSRKFKLFPTLTTNKRELYLAMCCDLQLIFFCENEWAFRSDFWEISGRFPREFRRDFPHQKQGSILYCVILSMSDIIMANNNNNSSDGWNNDGVQKNDDRTENIRCVSCVRNNKRKF